MKGKNILKQTISFILIIFILTSSILNDNAHSLELSPNFPFTVDAMLWNEQGYSEYITSGKTTLGVDFTVKNTSSSSYTVKPYLALFKGSILFEAKSLTSQNLSSGEEINYSERFYVSGTKNDYSLKIFNWSEDTLEPLCKSVVFTETKEDFYGNSINDAVLIQNHDREVGGSLNNVNDVDYFKIIPKSTSLFSIACFSTTSTNIALYNSSGSTLKSNSPSIEYKLLAENTYYIKVSNPGNTGDYVLSVNESSNEDSNFNIYKFDEDINVYKKEILQVCNNLYNNDKHMAKEIYSNYEDVLSDDIKLHTLPEFLSHHPKDLSNFDELLNEYYKTKYNDFVELKQRYLQILENYDGEDGYYNPGDVSSPIRGKSPVFKTDLTKTDFSKATTPNNVTNLSSPSLTIVSLTATSITYSASFPTSGNYGNAIFITDFSVDNGITTYENLFRSNINVRNGTYTIKGLTPGSHYILSMMWSTDNGKTYGGINTINRRIKLPYSSAENLSLYSGKYVSARIEDVDRACASTANFNIWLNHMDSAYLALKELTGYTPYGGRKIELRSTREDLSELYEMPDGENYWELIIGMSGNPAEISQPFYSGLMKRLSSNDWGDVVLHELSHNFDQPRWEFDWETTAYLKMYYVLSELNGKVYRCDITEDYKSPWYTGTEYYDFLKNDCYVGYASYFDLGNYSSGGFAAILIDIQKEIGWEPFKKTFRYFSSLSTSQVPGTRKEKLRLFLTKLKDYSGEDVLDMINNRDTEIIEDWYNVTLEYTDPIYPSISEDVWYGDTSHEITATNGNYTTHQFTPTESANYYIYTSPYGGSGVSNDTYIEIYTNSSLSGTPIASNDDYDGERFSKVNVAMTKGRTYYIKVRHYNDGYLHADLNITKNIPVVELSLDDHEDINVAKGEYAMYSFTPENSMTYVFEVSNYNGGTTEYDTYIKLYGNQSMTHLIDSNHKKIIVNLTAGHTYYLQFSGFLMKSSRGRISIRQGQTIKFTKSTDSNFIFVNSPEYITKLDVVDDNMDIDGDGITERTPTKIFEQSGISGENTYFQTHLSWYGVSDTGNYFPQQAFYLDVDFYNESDTAVSLEINNLAYGTGYQIMGDYYKNRDNYTYIIEPGKHLLLFEELNAPLSVSSTENRPTILFDFNVLNGSVTVSSLAAYSRTNLYLKDNTQNVLMNSIELNRGYPELDYTESRPNESDYYGKYKGTAWNESSWIDADIEFIIDENTIIGEAQPIYLKDNFYDTVANPKWSWTTSLNPIDDDGSGTLSAMPGALHSFKYPSEFSDKEWHFDFLHHDLTLTNQYGSSNSINTEVSLSAINELKSIVESGVKQANYSIDPNALSMGEWGATYHYTISVTNTTNTDRTAVFGCRNFTNMTLGYKLLEENNYETEFHTGTGVGDNDWWEPVSYTVPAHETIAFEVVTNLGVSLGGTNYHFVVG